MSDSSNSHHTRAAAFGAWIVRWRWGVLLGTVAFALASGFGAQKLAFNNDYRVFFSDENPELQAFEELQRTYTKIDNVLFAVAPGLYARVQRIGWSRGSRFAQGAG